MNPFIIYFCAGGAFFAGLALCLASLFLPPSAGKSRLPGIARRLAYLAGGIFILLSSAPFHAVFYVLFIFLSIFHVADRDPLETLKRRTARPVPPGKQAKLFHIAFLLLLFCLEAPYYFPPRIKPSSDRTIFVFGDSLTAGTGFQEEKTWPEVLKEKSGAEISAFAIGGAGVKDLIRDSRKISGRKGTAVVLLGGNDIFGHTDIAEFENALDELLANLAADGRKVVMFELPLPPFHGGYGRAQRRLAEKHGAVLVPKYFVAYVLSGKNSTVDGLHLSNHGHAKMAEVAENFLP